MVLKCYPCIRGCGYVKGVLGAVLLMLTVYMTANQELKMNCSHMLSECILDFGVLIDQIHDRPNLHLTRQNDVQSMCQCVQRCVNYFSVFHVNGMAAHEGNCFKASAAAGMPGIATTGQSVGEATPLLPTIGTDECTRCSDAAEAQARLETSLGVLCAICGVAMFVTAGCEHVELKFHSAMFGVGVVVLDFICGVLLVIAMGFSISGAEMAREACDPTQFSAALKQAGTDSHTSDENKAAIFANLLQLLLRPLAEGVCVQFRPFSVCALVTAVASLSNMWACFVTTFLCLGCTDDGMDSDHEDDEKARDLHSIMNFN